MGLLQALIGYVRKSSKKLLQAIFGWAVQALFGTPKKSEETLLSAVVAISAAWPLILVGIAFPKIAALVLAFIPISKKVPSGVVRAAWIATGALVPIGVGLVLARRGDVHLAGEPFWKRAARGVPVTVAIGAAFAVAFVTSPLRRLIALSRRWEEEHVPLLIERSDYAAVARRLRETLEEAGLPVERDEPSWLLTAPSKVIRKIGGKTLRARLPEDVRHYRRDDLEVTIQPNAVALLGDPRTVARAHGVLSEQATLTPGLQTTAVEAQELEKRMKRIWQVWTNDPEQHEDSRVLLEQIQELSRELDETFLPFEQWQVLYRELLQLHRAITGESQLLEKSEEKMETISRRPFPLRAADRRPLESISTAALLSDAGRELGELARKEIALARTEFLRDLKAELAMARSFGIAAVAALCFVNMLFVAGALWLAQFLSPWVAALAVAGLQLLVTLGFAYAGWKKWRLPLDSTRKTLQKNWQWAKSRIA